MHVISLRKLRDFWSKPGNENAEAPLRRWHRVAEHSTWASITEIRETFASADVVEPFVVFDIGGNKYRLVVAVVFETKKIYVRHVLTHKEYDRGEWKKDSWTKKTPPKRRKPG